MTPLLVTLSGNQGAGQYDVEGAAEVLSGAIADPDLYLLENPTPENLRRGMERYPELLGFWATIAKGAAKFGKGAIKGIGKIAKRARAKRAAKRAGAAAARQGATQAAAAAAAAAAAQERQAAEAAAAAAAEAKRKRQKMILIGAAVGLPLAALLFIKMRGAK
jgi:hypothetical protein